MGLLFKNKINILVFIVISCFIMASLHAQVQVTEIININNLSDNAIDEHIIQFWNHTHDIDSSFIITSIRDLSIKNTQSNIPNQSYLYYLPIDHSFYKFCKDSLNIVRFLSHTSTEIEQLLISNKKSIILVDMRHPLSLILDSLASLSYITEDFKVKITEQARILHKSNWSLRHVDNHEQEPGYIDNEGFYWASEIKSYNPKEW